MTSPIFTAWPGATTRPPLTLTRPPVTRPAAAGLVLTIRACHNHLSMRCRSMTLAAARSDRNHGTEHDLRANASRLSRGKPVPTFPDHALALLLGAALELLLQRGELGKGRVRVDRPLAWRTRREVTLAPLMPAFVAMTIVAIATTTIIAITALLVGRTGRSSVGRRCGDRALGSTLRWRSASVRSWPVTMTAAPSTMLLARAFVVRAMVVRILRRRRGLGRFAGLPLGARLVTVMATFVPWAPIFESPAWTPYLDQLWCGGSGRFGRRHRAVVCRRSAGHFGDNRGFACLRDFNGRYINCRFRL